MGFFETGDKILNNGGQVALDAAALIPGYGEISNGAQALYHGGHAINDLREGNYKEAAAQGLETLWNGANAIPGVHELMEPIHIAELAYDAGATATRWAGGPDGKSLIGAASEGLVEMGEAGAHAVGSAGRAIGNGASSLARGAGSAISGAGRAIGSGASSLATGAGRAISGAGSAIGSGVSSVARGAGNAVAGAGRAISGAGSAIGSGVSSAARGAGNAVAGAGRAVGNAASSAWNWMTGR